MEPFRILHVVGNMNAGGMETLIMNIYRKINKDLIQFDFLVHSSNKSAYEDEIINLGGNIFHFTLLDDMNILKYIKDLNEFFRKHSEFKVVHGHHSAFGYLYLKIAKNHGVSCRIAHSHIAFFSKTIKGYLKFLVTRFFKKYATVKFACSKAAGDYMYGKNSNYSIIRNGIDAKQFSFSNKLRQKIRDDFRIKSSTIVVGHVGRFHDQKNHSFIVDVFSEYRKKNPDSVLLLIGIGPLLEEIKLKVKKLNLQDSVFFLGERNDVSSLMQAFDVVLFPSLYEGLPLTLIEAQASGLPIVCSDTITDETCISTNYHRLSLNDKKDLWVIKILECINNNREIAYRNVIENGYDSQNVANDLLEFYLSFNK